MRNSKPKPKRSKKGGKSKDDEEDEVMIVSESPPPTQRQLRSSKQQTSKTSPFTSSLSINKPSKVTEKSAIISIDVNESETTKKLDHRKVETRSRQQQNNSTTDTDKNKTTSDFDLLKRGFDDNDDEEAGFEQQKATETATTKQVAIIRDEEPISKSTSSSKPPSSKRNKLEKEDESKKIIVEQENTPSIAKEVIRVKNEPVNDDLTLEPKKRSVGLTSRTNLNATTVVYSKNKPPPESLIKHETSMPLDESISEIKVKVKFEPMIKRSSIKRENMSTLGSSSSSGGENGQRNFKKFKKVPKASQKAVGEKSIFKSVKQEKFDLDSQFNEFMNSMR